MSFPLRAPREPACDGGPDEVVLIVEDDPDLLELLSIWFRGEHRTVIAALSADEALARTSGVIVDLAVVDLILGGLLDGWQLIPLLRTQHAGTRIVICSMLDPEDHPAADETLPKPCSRGDVSRLLRRLEQAS
ncbi:response regulator [Nakamurella leprariae]|uniref:Response regulator n=1 Tax=Nakamurella leprariae TaxID=2803911 RepID=A0A938YEY6_9ACTN|nr:response regulator [Nakamurella leprariae]MBM9468306.1 response regulator [Nakamurella leprariae]